MGFYVPGEIRFLCEIARPKIGVITNIGTVHAERAGSQEIIAQGKAELVESLPANGVAILNYDDPFVRQMADKTSARVLFYGLSPAADLWADQVEGLGLEGIRFRLHYRNEVLHLRVPMLGRHSVHTALRTAAVGLAGAFYFGPFHIAGIMTIGFAVFIFVFGSTVGNQQKMGLSKQEFVRKIMFQTVAGILLVYLVVLLSRVVPMQNEI